MATIQEQSGGLARMLEQTRAMTQELVSVLEPDDYVVQTADYTSPQKWHVGHVSWIYEMVMRRMDPSYEATPLADSPYLNSYYNGAGTPHPKADRGRAARPATGDLLAYFEEITQRLRPLASGPLGDKAASLLTLAVHHEMQHQELMVYDLQHMLASDYAPARRLGAPAPPRRELPKSVHIRGGVREIGHAGGGFCYDVESPAHRVYLEDYEIDALPVTCGEYEKFIADGGYADYRHWLSDGWDAARKNSWEAPMYWSSVGGRWHVRDFGGLRPVNPDEPVCCLSYYEADAYARWAGRRLPTEAEWEVAACYDESAARRLAFPWGDAPPEPSRANLLESRIWARTPVGSYPDSASPSGCEQMIGDVWEWTSSEFVPYPGFESGFEEYNDKWFGGQKVLRGGSSATPGASIRPTYRNFFRPEERWMFAGFRCAA